MARGRGDQGGVGVGGYQYRCESGPPGGHHAAHRPLDRLLPDQQGAGACPECLLDGIALGGGDQCVPARRAQTVPLGDDECRLRAVRRSGREVVGEGHDIGDPVERQWREGRRPVRCERPHCHKYLNVR